MNRAEIWAMSEAEDPGRLLRWAASLRKTSADTRAEADAQGPAWPYYELSLRSSADQAAQAFDLEQIAEALGLTAPPEAAQLAAG